MSTDATASTAGRRQRPRSTQNQGTRHRRVAFGAGLPWIIPAVVLVVGMIYFSIADTIHVSTLDWNGFILSPSRFVGWDNYSRMFQDPVFWLAIWHTGVFFVTTFVVQTLIGFTFAALMHSKVVLAPLYKVIIFIPTVLAPATMAPVFRHIFDAKGDFNAILSAVGLDWLAQPWLAGDVTAMLVVMVATVWQWTGLTFILYYAAMSQIETEILEAARIDGSSNFRTLLAIVWPLCRPTTVALATLGIIGALKTFDVPYLVTKAGPNHATEFLGTYIYQTMVQQKHFGYAAAISIALLILAIVGGVVMRRPRREKEGS